MAFFFLLRANLLSVFTLFVFIKFLIFFYKYKKLKSKFVFLAYFLKQIAFGL